MAGQITRAILTTREQLPFEVQASASWIPNLHRDRPDEYVAQARVPMSAHLVNTAPGASLLAVAGRPQK